MKQKRKALDAKATKYEQEQAEDWYEKVSRDFLDRGQRRSEKNK